MRSPENVLESLKSKACNKSYKYERLYRNLYNPQFYLLAYQRIQAKPGNMTAGTDGKTIDGMGMAKRLKANKCEWCGAENIPLEMHHIRKLKDLKGRKQWEIAMIGRKRKTMALCVNCHDKLHAGKLD